MIGSAFKAILHDFRYGPPRHFTGSALGEQVLKMIRAGDSMSWKDGHSLRLMGD